MLREAGVPFTVLRNGYYTEVYTDPLGRYLNDGEILGASGGGALSAATRQHYATAAAAALLHPFRQEPESCLACGVGPVDPDVGPQP